MIGENEPISTLTKFRAFKGSGVAFGTYYAIDLLNSKNVFEEMLPKEWGYPSYSESTR